MSNAVILEQTEKNDTIKHVLFASHVASFLFCEYTLQKEVIETEAMKTGKELHAEYEVESQQKITGKITLQEAKNLKHNLIIAEELLVFPLKDLLLVGQPDRAERKNGTWIIHEKKTTKKNCVNIYDSHRIQAYFYCELIQRVIQDEANYTWQIHIQNQDTEKIIKEENGSYGPRERQFLLKTIIRIRNILEGKEKQVHHNKQYKCRYCTVKDCPHKLF